MVIREKLFVNFIQSGVIIDIYYIHARPPSGDGIPSEGSNTLPQSVMNN